VNKIFIYCFILLIVSCTAGGGYEKAENAQDAGREFIRALLDGDHPKARFYLLQDTTNLLLIERQQSDYNRLSAEEKTKHRESTIRPIDIRKINDTATSYQYFNTYNPKDTTTIMIVKSKGDWLVDLKSILKQ
jgi:multidrug efflux pump subunit AcrB